MANEISNANAGSVTDSDGNPVEDAQIIAVKQEDTANLSQSQATEITALAKLTDANGDFTITKDELYDGTNQYHVVANVENNEQRGTPNYPHVDATKSTIPDSVVDRPDDTRTFSESTKNGLVFEAKANWPEIGAIISNQTSGVSTAYLEQMNSAGDTIQSTIDTTDISALSSGDPFTFDSANISDGDVFAILLDNAGGTYTMGDADDGDNYPLTTANLDCIGGWFQGSRVDSNTRAIDEIGNTGFA